MRELEPAGHSAIDSARERSNARATSTRMAIVVSIVVHAVAVYALMQQRWVEVAAPPRTVADYFVFERPAPAPEEVPVEPVEERAIVSPRPEAEPERTAVEPATEPAAPRASEPAAPASEPTTSADEAAPADEPEPVAPPVPKPFIDFDEESRRAAREIVTERAAENEYLTFSIDDVAPPRPEAEPERKSIFDGAGGPSFGGRSVGTVGQQRTKLGRKLAEFCNALTGGFGVAFQGFGLFSACASPNSGPSGLFPEVRPAYLDLMPECVDTRDTAPALALEAPFPTVKCRLVKREELADEP